MKMLILVAAMIFSAITAQAGAKLSPDLKMALANKQSNERMAVLVLFRDRQPVRIREGRYGTHRRVQQAMMDNARSSQYAVLQELSSKNKGAIRIRIKPLWIVNGVLVEAPVSILRGLVGRNEISSMTTNEQVGIIRPAGQRDNFENSQFTYGLEKVGIPQVRTAHPGLTGKGVNVGIIDTGIDANHPALRGRTVAWRDFVSNRSEPYDDNGHGTHCAGTIGGTAANGTEIGVAPDVRFTVAKVFSGSGSASRFAILEAMQWMADPDGDPNTLDRPALVSNSWGGGFSNNGSEDPAEHAYCQAVDNWVKLGIFPVFANGNSGPRAGSVGVPAACPSSFAVGATDEGDRAASFSSRGPARWKTGSIIKPNISAPGVSVYSSFPGGKYRKLSGTSMATPHVAGLAALVFQMNQNLSSIDVGQILIRSSVDLGSNGNDDTFGWGRASAGFALQR
ncbi:MAG: hypothetical protein CL675_13160 [Bdellovibrionaceae bacterium]|nr:hypothetical protein [Pseudobdellovibrionaceae bacterium]